MNTMFAMNASTKSDHDRPITFMFAQIAAWNGSKKPNDTTQSAVDAFLSTTATTRTYHTK